jgi:hypothetical protein
MKGLRYGGCVVAIACLSGPVTAAPLTEANAIAIAKKLCAEQIAESAHWKWHATLYRDAWAVGASPEGNALLHGGVIFSIPLHEPMPKRCVRFKFE